MTGLGIARASVEKRASFEKPGDVVSWLGAVQAQDCTGAKWALGQRMRAATDSDVEQAFTEGSILRTHLMRPTWHFVTPADIRWMLALTAPHVHAVNATYYRKLELDQTLFTRSNDALVKALQGGEQPTRDELRGAFQQAGLAAKGKLRMSYLMMRAELDGIVCSGPRRGKQFTYMLLDERAPQARTLERDEALSELTQRYFMSRGPAMVQDFVKWSELTTAESRRGLEMVQTQLRQEMMDGKVYWLSLSTPTAKDASPSAYLLSVYDEYISGYKDRSATGSPETAAKLSAMGNALYYVIIVDGQIVGTWKRTLKKDAVVLEMNIFTPLTDAEEQAVTMAAHQYGVFLGLPVVLG
jgi:hypothetical protein